jgi:hypothetical protein
MQNKPNFQKAEMKLNLYSAKDYENKPRLKISKNKPNQTQPVVSRVEPTCSELARPELACGELVEPVEGVEPISKRARSRYNYFNLFFIFIGLSPVSWYNTCQLGLFSRLSGIFS